ncbi:MAG TPA: pilus assembly protein PilP [Thermoanaerobaculia bacterium]|jgi:Tfp pilus assembly protein PilP
MRARRFLAASVPVALLILCAPAPAFAQAPPAQAPPAQAPPAASNAPVEAAGTAGKVTEQDFVPSVYTYEVGGRRDPFRSLLVRNPSDKDRVRPPGLAGVMVDELELQGTIKIKQGWVAMMRGPDNKSHLIRKGTTLFDGEVVEVSATEVTFRQNVNDPTNPKPFREVVKALTLQKKS